MDSLTLRDGIAVQELAVGGGQRVLSVLGVNDPIKDPFTKPGARICGAPWATLFERAGVTPDDIWPGGAPLASPASCTIWSAKLFPLFETPQPGAGGDHTAAAVLHDRASLWLQWLAPATTAEGGGVVVDSAFNAFHVGVIAGKCLAEEVLTAWRNATRLSLKDILGMCDARVEFGWRRALRGKVDVKLLVSAVAAGGNNVPVGELVKRLGRGALSLTSTITGAGVGTVLEGTGGGGPSGVSLARLALAGLDEVAAAPTTSPDVASRALAIESALLWCMAGWGTHGQFSGPAHNAAWLPAFALLEGVRGDATGGAAARSLAVAQLAALRDSWGVRAHQMGRAARHYERAAQLLVAQCVFTAGVAFPLPSAPLPALGSWVIVTAPARVDLAGGWSDTPPITYEAVGDGLEGPAPAEYPGDLAAIAAAASDGGGLVVNVAVTVDGERPLGCRARRTPPSAGVPRIVIRTRGLPNDSSSGPLPTDTPGAPGVVVSSIECGSLASLSDFNQPMAEGALVKCALLLLLGGLSSTGEELAARLQGALAGAGLEIESWSLLPQGSGLGTSSILAATVLVCVARAMGRVMPVEDGSLTHAVLKLEQMLSTGGGWQDQVGGIFGGLKASACAPRLPVAVRILPIPWRGGAAFPSPDAMLSAHLFLVCVTGGEDGCTSGSFSSSTHSPPPLPHPQVHGQNAVGKKLAAAGAAAVGAA